MIIRQQFEQFHAANPQVYDKLVELARKVRARGFTQYSLYALYNVARWHFTIEQDGSEEFKLNNNYQPYYARLLMTREPDLFGLFQLRATKA
jgi:hypothetical protein